MSNFALNDNAALIAAIANPVAPRPAAPPEPASEPPSPSNGAPSRRAELKTALVQALHGEQISAPPAEQTAPQPVAGTGDTATLDDREAAVLRREVVADLGLPAGFATRLQGTTREELEADAAALQALLTAHHTPARLQPSKPAVATRPVNGGAPGTQPRDPLLEALKRAL